MTTLLLHGLGGTRQNILSYVPFLQDQPNARVIAPDVTGHGGDMREHVPEDYALEALAAECAAHVRAAWDGRPLTIVGVSMGAAIGLRIALSGEFPLDRIAFLRPSFTWQPLPENLAVFPVISELLGNSRSTEVALDRLRASGAYCDVRRVTRVGAAALEAQVTQPHAGQRRMRLSEIPRNVAFTGDELSRVNAPTVVFASPRDPVHPVHIAEAWAGGLRSRLFVSPARDDGQAAAMSWYRDHLANFLTPV